MLVYQRVYVLWNKYPGSEWYTLAQGCWWVDVMEVDLSMALETKCLAQDAMFTTIISGNKLSQSGSTIQQTR